ncbi:hypothetical protein [Pseudodesulfovibrio methanolicus]|uniref:N-acetyltransferase domain-containing protein n=1 Tax=Pseudodesulfovibrio methanolicus TaxID=3126690 RepID=A0ABZ2ITM3_9BACT
MSKFKIIPVRSSGEIKQFVDLPWTIYKDSPNWVPPIKKNVMQLLTPGKHPFWEFANRELFLLKQGRKVIGRIAAIVDDNYNKYHHEKAGGWGFFECIDDQEAANMLFDAAEVWLREAGMEYMHGPFNPSTNYEVAMLIKGGQVPPVLMMTYNPDYYPALVEASGQTKEKDLFAFKFNRGHQLPEWVTKIANRLVDKGEVTIRHLDMKKLNEEVVLMNTLYRAAWADNWAFVPATDAEIAIQAHELKDIIEPRLAFFLYHGDEPIGVGVILPDANPLLKEFNGKLGVTALYKLLRHKSKIIGTRCIIFGVKPKYHQTGVPLVALDYIMKMSEEFPQYKHIEMSWTLEDNAGINDLLEDFGGDLYKKYRIYRKDF